MEYICTVLGCVPAVSVTGGLRMLCGQQTVENVLVIIIMLCVILILVPKPVILTLRHKRFVVCILVVLTL